MTNIELLTRTIKIMTDAYYDFFNADDEDQEATVIADIKAGQELGYRVLRDIREDKDPTVEALRGILEAVIDMVTDSTL